jgi:hypothetical protein
MANAIKFDLKTSSPMTDPVSGSGDVYLFPEAMGQGGQPFVMMVEDPPLKTRPRHYHHGDVLYVYTKGEHHIEGEGTYRAGDLRWTRAGHAYGPETTGPEGGAWWIISYSDPIPVNVEADGQFQEKARPVAQAPAPLANQLPHFARPYDWAAIDQAVLTTGGAILEGLVSKDLRIELSQQIDAYLAGHDSVGQPASGSMIYDMFLGHKTVRLHGLVEKAPKSADLIGTKASSVLLNAGELIQIGPDEPAQYLHRDTDSWADLPIEPNPILVNAIIAFDPFTLTNGATYIAPESWSWDQSRQPKTGEMVRAVMEPGDAVLFRGDLLHGGGENCSPAPRRAISVSYCAGWLRPVENSFLNVSVDAAKNAPPKVQALLGYAPHDGLYKRGGLLGLYENGDPARVLAK